MCRKVRKAYVDCWTFQLLCFLWLKLHIQLLRCLIALTRQDIITTSLQTFGTTQHIHTAPEGTEFDSQTSQQMCTPLWPFLYRHVGIFPCVCVCVFF